MPRKRRTPATKQAPSETDLQARADAALARGDQDAALRLYATARSRFPAATWAWLRAAEIETRARRFTEADALLEDAIGRFPDDFWIWHAHALIAKEQGDKIEAYTRLRALRQAFPDDPVAHSSFVHLLLDLDLAAAAEAEAQASIARFPNFDWLQFMYARCADEVADPATAAARWTNLLLCHPGHEAAYAPATRALLKAERSEEAVGIAREALRLLPDADAARDAWAAIVKAGAAEPSAPSLAEPAETVLAAALRAEQTGDWPDAARLWARLRDQVPALALAYAQGARALLRLDRAAEAEIVLAKARRDMPPDAGVLGAWADAALQRGAWEDALARFQALRQAFPAAPDAVRGMARALHGLGRLDEADAIFAELIRQQPSDLALAEEFARMAAERGDAAEAIRRWASVTAAFPGHLPGYRQLAETLLQAGRATAADLVLTQAVSRFPDDLETALCWVKAGQAGAGPEESRSRWDELCRRFPGMAAVARG